MNRTSVVFLLIWLAASIIATLMALQLESAAFAEGSWIPVGNDSFYHARRILDAAVGERGFYQFDNMIHVPEGSWLNWPWAYDWFIAAGLSVVLWLRPSADPMAVLVQVPVFFVFVNIGLATLIAKQVRLAPPLAAIAIGGMALLPLTQTLHGVGIIDHHFIEQTFVLAALLAGLRFFERARAADAIVLGTVLGIAPAFHNGLFILQLPVLMAVFALWLRDAPPASALLLRLGLSLVIATLLVALPSAAFLALQFEFWTLSWFHVYVACASAAALVFLSRQAPGRQGLARLAILCAVLIAPLFAKLLTGAAFLAGDLILLDSIVEVQSPFRRLVGPGGVRWVSSYYGWLILAAPILALAFAHRAWHGREPAAVFFSVFAVFGLLLLLTQYRLHPFGTWAIFIGGMLVFDEARRRYELSLTDSAVAALVVVVVAMQPSLRNLLFYEHPPGLSRDYAITHSLFVSMADTCAERAGTALSYTDDGHYIRYHTDCSVLTNNFLMTPLHKQKVLEADTLLQMTPAQFVESAPPVDYVFVRMFEIFESTPMGMRPRSREEIAARNAPLFVALTFAEEVPPGFRLVDERRVRDPRDFAYARVFEVVNNDEGR